MGGILKGVGKLVGIDYDGAVRAGKEQAAATRDAAAQAATDAAFQAQSAMQQMQVAAMTRQQQQMASDLLNKPVATADVDLASAAVDSGADNSDDLLTKRRGARSTYQASSKSSGLVV